MNPRPPVGRFVERDGAATKQQKNIEHRTTNTELRTWRNAMSRWMLNLGSSKFDVRCSMFDVWMFGVGRSMMKSVLDDLSLVR